MEAIQYARPSTIDDAVRRLGETGARVLAGGTDLLVQMRGGLTRPRLIVDIKGIAELRRVEQTPQGFRVGAADTLPRDYVPRDNGAGS